MTTSDFYQYFYPAAYRWLLGVTPYHQGIYNPLWAWWLMGPLAAWPVEVAYFMWMLLSVGVLLLTLALIRRPHPLIVLGLLLTPAALVHGAMGQWTVWLLLGVWLLQSRDANVQGTGLLLLLIKPHLGWPLVLMTRPRAWLIPLLATLLSLLVRPQWPIEALAALRNTPPVGYQILAIARPLTLGTPFLVALAVVAILLAAGALYRYRPSRRWQLALLCAVAPLLSPYSRLYDNVLLFYPILILTENRPGAWLPLVVLLWLPLILLVEPWAIFVDWLLPLVLLLLLVRALAYDAADRAGPPVKPAIAL